ncbi:MAG: putative lipid II flippase FtsW [Brevinematales bacterium]|nr:putative lipid II flippase FtsW [Brevinematales bacterium]
MDSIRGIAEKDFSLGYRIDKIDSRDNLLLYIQMIFITSISLIIVGLTFILSSTYLSSLQKYGNPFVLFLKQLLWILIGIVSMILLSKIDTSFYKRYVKLILLIGIVVGILPFIPGIGKAKGDAFRWINLGFINISSSEVIKMVLIIYISVVMSRKKDTKNFFNVFLPIFLVVTIFFMIISLQLDISMAFLILLSGIIVMYVGGIPVIQIFLTILTSSIFIFLISSNFPYLQNRIIAFLDPWSDPFGKGYHYISMIKSFQNGIFGVGLGNGIIKEKSLPESHTDSIFAVIGEETGIIGTSIVLLLITLFFYYSLKLAIGIKDTYKTPLIVGLASLISVWGIVNILVITGLLPPTGTNLPLISYGGANIITSLSAIGIIYRCYKEHVSISSTYLATTNKRY